RNSPSYSNYSSGSICSSHSTCGKTRDCHKLKPSPRPDSSMGHNGTYPHSRDHNNQNHSMVCENGGCGKCIENRSHHRHNHNHHHHHRADFDCLDNSDHHYHRTCYWQMCSNHHRDQDRNTDRRIAHSNRLKIQQETLKPNQRQSPFSYNILFNVKGDCASIKAGRNYYLCPSFYVKG